MANQGSNNTEALQALLQSIGPEAAQNVSPEALQALSDKLSELMGADVVRDAFAYNDQHPSGSEALVNEEGLPIIDITEPIYPAQSQSPPTADAITNPIILEEPPLIPLSTLPPSERDLRRRERERILDLLEAEEALEQHRDRQKEAQERREALDKRREDGKTERERLLALRETHKKMGKALIREVTKEKHSPLSPEPSSVTSSPPSHKKKSVSFAETEASASSEPESTATDWGDVLQGRLRPAEKRLAPSFSKESERLMKLHVVERVSGHPDPAPAETSTHKQPTRVQITTTDGDSDDESDVGSGSHSDDGAPLNDSSEHSDVPDSDLEEELDLDFVQHQREIALEYQRKRETFGRETAIALTSHAHEPDEDPSVPEISSNKPKSSISQFRANRLVSSYASSTPSSSSSQAFEPSIVSAAGAQTLQNAIRLGKIDDQERLVGGEDGDSGSEDEVAREIIELLQKGEVYNLGPDGAAIHIVPPISSPSQVGPLSPFTPPTEPLPQRTKPSRFKFERPKLTSTVSLDSSGLNTPVSNVGRSSPKSPSMTESVVERTVPTAKKSKLPGPNTVSSMIVESPSFPQGSSASRRPEHPPTIMSSQVVESSRTDNRPSQTEVEGPMKRVSRFKAERM